MPCLPGGSLTSRTVVGPNGGLYTLTVVEMSVGPAGTRICYELSVQNGGTGGNAPAASHITIQFCPGQACGSPIPPFVITSQIDGGPPLVLEPCPPEPLVDCFEAPGPFPQEPLVCPAIKVNFAPEGPGPGTAPRIICVTFPGQIYEFVPGVFQIKAGNDPSFPALPDENCTIYTINCAEEGCKATGFQRAEVCVPVTVRPFATPGTPTVRCCGAADVTTEPCTDGFVLDGSCTFTIAQEICVEVPVDVGATVDPLTQTFVQCEAPSNLDCTDCTPPG